MAVTRLTDVLEPDVWEPYMRLRTMELSALFEGGLVLTDPEIDRLVSGGGTLFQMPTFDDLLSGGSDASVIGDDNPATVLTPRAIGTSKDQAVKHLRNQAWGSARILKTIIGADPMQAIADKVAGYWAREFQDMLISSQTGVLADNVANDSGDMLYDIATDSAAAITAAERVSADAVLQATQTLGDAGGMLQTMAMHSVIATELKRQNLIDFIPNSEGRISFGTYLDKLVIIDDGQPAVMATNRITYDTYLFVNGAYGFGRGEPDVPVAVQNEELQGNGSGIEAFASRQILALHPRGISFTDASVAAESPTNTELEAAANWDRVYPERKQIGLAFLQTNG